MRKAIILLACAMSGGATVGFAASGPAGDNFVSAGAMAKESPATDPVNHLCERSEMVVFSCALSGERAAKTPAKTIVSVCLDKSSITYKEGASKTAMRTIASNPQWKNIHLGSVVGASGGHQSHIRFTSETGKNFIVFEAAPGQYHDVPNTNPRSGVTIIASDKTEQYRQCSPHFGGFLGRWDFDRLIRDAAPAKVFEDSSIYEVEGGPFDGWF